MTVFREQVVEGDAAEVERMTRATGKFREDEIAIAVELVQDGLTKGAASDYRFAFVEGDHGLAAYACWGQTPCTLGTWDLYWIAVDPNASHSITNRRFNASSVAGRSMLVPFFR